MPQTYIDTKALAHELGRPVTCIQRWARMRLIPCVRVGWRTRLYDPEAVRAALEKLTVREHSTSAGTGMPSRKKAATS